SVSAQINRMSLQDERLQLSKDAIDSSQWGIGLSSGRQGFSLAYYSPQTESGTYVSPNTGDTARMEVSLKELRFTTARAFFSEALSIGASIELLKAVRELNDSSSGSYGVSYRLGAIVRLPRHVLLGASFTPEATIGPASDPESEASLPGFNRSVVRPMQLGFGIGWIPNRFFRSGFSLTYVARTRDTALLADESIATGAFPTWVPRVGASYVLAELAAFKIEGALGAYYEISRLSDRSDRVHATLGLEVNPSFVNLGVGFDLSSAYRNFVVSVGIDIVRAARSLELIPRETLPPPRGFWPPFKELSPDELPPGVTGPVPNKHKPESIEKVRQILKDVPEKIVDTVEGER
ncbi:MAG TPA: hypothetical protein VM598_09440, partial [Bdellovibrionota bacterium]|nr:hypothetical protein [Bdellovibrionota bacterium]